MGRLIWTGVACCLCALALNLFPRLVFEFGMDPRAGWGFFAFGLFLILVGAAFERRGGSGGDGSRSSVYAASRRG